ncbi:MAG: 5'-nucleotidase [Deltaproteobacteria bacterium]|nr:5'-nucleotidase [Deltaproteobacteria bacterium]
MRRRLSILLPAALAVTLLAAPGCIAFNEECSSPPDLVDPDTIIGYLAAPIPVTENRVRTEEMAIGNLVADAFADAFNNPANPNHRDTVSPVDGAIENAGGIRNEGFCAEVDSLPGDPDDPPPLTRADLREVMPFTNRVVVVELNAAEVIEIFEHSVSALGDPDDPDKGFFLQVSEGMEVIVDCTGTPQEVVEGAITVPGTRVQAIRFGDRVPCAVQADCPAGNVCDTGRSACKIDPADTTTLYRVATNDYLLRADGNDGFATLAGRPGFNSLGRLDVEAVEDYLDLHSSPVLPYEPRVEGRLVLDNCD